jgi:hypothetical protein
MASVLAATLVLAAAAAGERSALEAQPKGWIDILPGPGLAGWSRVAPISTAGVKSVVNKDLAIWVVDRKTGILDCRGHLPPAPPGGKDGSHEMLRHDKEVGDFIFHVEWRFTDPARPGWNAGVYARVRDDAAVWHQAQVGAATAGYWFGDTPDESGKIVRRKLEAREARVKPAGEWNVYEITGRGDTLTLWVNGAVTSVMSGLKILRGHVGLEAELHHIEFRNLKLKELPGK